MKPNWKPIVIRLGDIIPWTENPRMSVKADAERLIASEKRWGQPQPFSVSPFDEDGKVQLYDGHQRYSAWLTVYGEDHKVAASQCDRYLTDDERAEYVFTMHAGATGRWDWDKVASFPQAVRWGMDEAKLKEWNSDAGQLKQMLEANKAETVDAEPQTDRAAELLEKWQVKTGDLWQIGEHRLLCGDSTKREDVERVMGGESFETITTDPPYAFGLGSTGEERNKSGGWHDMMNNSSWFTSLLNQWQEIARNGIWWMFCNWRTLPIVMRAAYEASEGIESVLVWDKQWIGPGGSKGLRPSYELVVLFCNGDAAISDRGQPDIFRSMWASAKPTGHKAEKPVPLFEHLIKLSKGDVFDPFCGSGTTLVACQNLGRRGRGIEISPAYCAVTLQRMADAFPELEIKRL